VSLLEDLEDISSQVKTDCARIDLDNPDQNFQIELQDNGNERFCAQEIL